MDCSLRPPDLYQALVCLQCSGGDAGGSLCLEGGTAGNQLVLGRVSVDRAMRWAQLTSALNQIFTSYLQTVCGEAPAAGGGETARLPLGLGPGSISSILIGEDTPLRDHAFVIPFRTFLQWNQPVLSFCPAAS